MPRDRKTISTESAPEAIGPYSQAVRCGDLLFCSGQIPLEPSLREGGDVGKPVVEADPTVPAAAALLDVAQRLAGRSRGLAGMQLGLTPSSKF